MVYATSNFFVIFLVLFFSTDFSSISGSFLTTVFEIVFDCGTGFTGLSISTFVGLLTSFLGLDQFKSNLN